MTPSELYIVSSRRTAIASPFKGFKDLTAADLAVAVARDILAQVKGSDAQIDEVIFGNAVAAGTGQNMSRQIVYRSGLASDIPGYMVNAVCGSGLQAVILACRTILAQDAHVILAGGTESATHSPELGIKTSATAEPTKADSLDQDGLLCAVTQKYMGELCESLAQKYKISREQQDAFAYESHQKAGQARDSGKFLQEIVGVKTAAGVFNHDERPRLKLDMARLAALPPAFGSEGTITAGNSSAPADGACGLLLASGAAAQKHHWQPMARILGYSSVAVEPQWVFTGAVKATEAVLQKTGLKIKDIDLFEVTESFSAQAIYTQQQLKIPAEKMNIFGGDVALGHPLGTAGSRALVTLLHALKNQGKKTGLVSVCFGGGGAIAMIVENNF